MEHMSTPHARGSTSPPSRGHRFCLVYPACAGIHPQSPGAHTTTGGLPRMRGDPPKTHRRYAYYRESTPHARGSTPLGHQLQCLSAVYPACAGIHPQKVLRVDPLQGLPRMRGDPPFTFTDADFAEWSTPHARGSTLVEVFIA